MRGWSPGLGVGVVALFAVCGCPAPPVHLDPIGWASRGVGLSSAEVALPGHNTIYALRFDQSLFRLRILSPPGGLHVPDDRPIDAVAIWNGGYFEPDLRPSGLVLDHGRQVSAPSAGHALLLMGERFSLVRFGDPLPSTPQESALQLWPFLIEPGGGDGIRRDDGKRARRSAVALDDGGRGILIGVLGDGVTLHQLMLLCRRLGAVVAANLDGGPSTGFAVGPDPGWRVPSETAVANALVLSPRGPR